MIEENQWPPKDEGFNNPKSSITGPEVAAKKSLSFEISLVRWRDNSMLLLALYRQQAEGEGRFNEGRCY
jgi:hypothetical protein